MIKFSKQEDFVVAVIIGVFALIFLALVLQSGILPLALLGWVGVSAVTFYFSREPKTTVVVGGIAALVISLLGVVVMLSSG